MAIYRDTVSLSLVITRKRKGFDIRVPNFTVSVLSARNCSFNEAIPLSTDR